MWGCCIRSQIFFPQIFGCIHRMQSFHVQQPVSLYAEIDSLYFTYLCNIIFNSDTIAVCVPNGRWALTPPISTPLSKSNSDLGSHIWSKNTIMNTLQIHMHTRKQSPPFPEPDARLHGGLAGEGWRRGSHGRQMSALVFHKGWRTRGNDGGVEAEGED